MKFRHLSLATLVILGLQLAPAAAQQWGTLTGRFVYGGKAPEQRPIQITKDIQYCGKHDLKYEDLIVGSDGGLKNVIITLYRPANVKVHPSYASSAEDKVEIDNNGCRFDPHVVLLRTSQTLVIGNKDPIGHNTKVETLSNLPINPIVPANGSLDAKFPKPERLPVKVSCNIHPWMSAWLVVKGNPYMAVTDEHGNFKIANLPAGQALTLQVWQEAAGYVDNVTFKGKPTRWRRGRFEITIKPGTNELGEVKVAPEVFK